MIQIPQISRLKHVRPQPSTPNHSSPQRIGSFRAFSELLRPTPLCHPSDGCAAHLTERPLRGRPSGRLGGTHICSVSEGPRTSFNEPCLALPFRVLFEKETVNRAALWAVLLRQKWVAERKESPPRSTLQHWPEHGRTIVSGKPSALLEGATREKKNGVLVSGSNESTTTTTTTTNCNP